VLNNLQEDNNKGQDINFNNLITLKPQVGNDKGQDINSGNLIVLNKPQ
jgi:hypothetical protein